MQFSRKLLFAAYLFIVSGTLLYGQTPALINYQGQLVDGSGDPREGNFDVQFSIFDDPAAGTEQWTETHSALAVSEGLFNVLLGSVAEIPENLFAENDSLYLQIAVGAETLSPRQRISSVAYALHSHKASLLVDDAITPSMIKNGAVTNNKLFANAVSTAKIATGAVTGPKLATGAVGSTEILNNSIQSVDIQDNTLTNVDILDSPGIAQGRNTGSVILTTSEMSDIVTVTITIPAAGYIFVQASAYVQISGSVSQSWAFIQVDETEGGGGIAGLYTLSGLHGYVSTGTSFFDASAQRTYFKSSAGTYTFRLEAYKSQAASSISMGYATCTALYFPVARGTVTAITSDIKGLREYETINAEAVGSPSGASETVYKTDLRQLELEATRARLEAEKAENSFIKAKLENESGN